MAITSALVLFLVIWCLTFLLVLPFGQVSQHEAGDVVPGTPASAPEDARIRRKMVITTIIAVIAYVVVMCAILLEWVSILDLPFLTPPSAR